MHTSGQVEVRAKNLTCFLSCNRLFCSLSYSGPDNQTQHDYIRYKNTHTKIKKIILTHNGSAKMANNIRKSKSKSTVICKNCSCPCAYQCAITVVRYTAQNSSNDLPSYFQAIKHKHYTVWHSIIKCQTIHVHWPPFLDLLACLIL